MARIIVFGRLLRLPVLLLLIALVRSATGAEVTVTRTNLSERWITNVVEVRMPMNRFVNEYRTNWVDQVQARRVNVYATNWVVRTVTNRIVVNAAVTNFIEAYQTNWQTIRVTKVVPVELIRTNFVAVQRTNLTTLNFTNWHTIVVMKTNWVTQSVTNTVQIDLPATQTASAEPTAANDAKEPAIPTDAVLLGARRTDRPVANNLAEVRLTVRWASGAPAPFQVKHWRVERLDGAILCFGQDQEFTRELPVGDYKVEVRGRQDEKSPLLVARATLSLSAGQAIVKQKMIAKR